MVPLVETIRIALDPSGQRGLAQQPRTVHVNLEHAVAVRRLARDEAGQMVHMGHALQCTRHIGGRQDRPDLDLDAAAGELRRGSHGQHTELLGFELLAQPFQQRRSQKARSTGDQNLHGRSLL